MKKSLFPFLGLIAISCLFLSWECYSATYAYVANSNDNNVSIISTDDNPIVEEIVGVGNKPWGVAVAPKGEYVYVANNSDDTVSVIDTFDNSVSDPIDVGVGPYGVAVSPDGGYVYVANNSGDTVSVIDTSNNSVSASIDVGIGPVGVAVSPGGRYVYVTNNSDNTVSVIDTSNNSVSNTIEVGTGPYGVAVSPGGRYVYVANNSDDTVSVIDTYDNSVSAQIDVGAGPAGLAVSPDGGYVYVANNSDSSVSVIGTSNNSVSDTIDVGASPYGVAITPNGKYVYVINNVDGTVSVKASDNSVITVTVGNSPASLGIFVGGRAPEAPTNLQVTAVSEDKIELAWTDNSDDETGFKIERKLGSSGTYALQLPDPDKNVTVGPDVTSYSDTGLLDYRTYHYRVAATNEDAIDSYYSNEVEVTTKRDKSSACFIATAAYGSSMGPHVQLLRGFRDTFLLTNTVGKAFVNLYYTYSPRAALFIAKNNTLRTVVRWSLLPIVGMSWLSLKLGLAPTLTLMLLLLALISTTSAVFLKK